jgi:hypothetical protein
MENLPLYVSVIFGLTILLTVGMFYRAAGNSKVTLLFLLAWLVVQGFIGLSGFYTVTDTLPPRFLLLVLPPMFIIIALFTTKKGRKYLDKLDVKILTILHTLRIPVELVLFWLFIHHTVPELMTFEGRNFDILSGLTAPLVFFYFGYMKDKLNRKILLIWNFLCLGLLINIIIHGILSAPFPFQEFAFDQPNIALLHFPFIFLPGCIVPLVLLSHLAAIRQLIK